MSPATTNTIITTCSSATNTTTTTTHTAASVEVKCSVGQVACDDVSGELDPIKFLQIAPQSSTHIERVYFLT